jgi:trypsin
MTTIAVLAGIAMLALAPPALAQQTLGPQQQGDVKRERSVVNGAPISIQQAPWQVYVETTLGSSTSACGGSILDADTVITAAHCIFDASGVARAPATFDVAAGVSNLNAPAAGDQPQVVGVTSIRVHPGYNSVAGAGSPDDVATLQLDAPLVLGRPTAQSIPLSGVAPAIGSMASLTGFGQQDPNAQSNGQLYGLDTTVNNPLTCGGPANALYVCIVSATGSACRGDSGGPMTQNATLIGVASFVTGPDVNSICRAGSLNGYTNVTAGEINAFIQGNDAPPPAPRGGEDVSGQGSFRSGGTLTCSPGTWSNNPTFTYTIIDTRNGQVLQSGPSPTYRFTDADVGRTVACQVSATTPGGTGIALTEASPAIQAGPKKAQPKRPRLAVSMTAGRLTVRSGGRVSFAIRVSNRGGARARRVVVCDTPGRGLVFTRVPRSAQRSNGRVCWRISSLSAKSSRTMRITLRATRASRTRTVINRVSAQARNATTLRRDAVGVRVRGAQGSRPAPPVTGPYLGF